MFRKVTHTVYSCGT